MTQIISKVAGALEAAVTITISMLVSVFILALVAMPSASFTETVSVGDASQVSLAEASSHNPNLAPNG